MLFASDRARHQLARILSYLSYPGLAAILDADGRVVAAHGRIPGSVEQLAEEFGTAFGAVLIDEPCAFGEQHHVYRYQLQAYLLLLVMPIEVPLDMVRFARAVTLVEKMLTAPPTSSPTPSDPGSGAPAHVSVPTRNDVDSRR